jgi:hypothetical protein
MIDEEKFDNIDALEYRLDALHRREESKVSGF